MDESTALAPQALPDLPPPLTPRPFTWTTQKARAAMLLAKHETSDAQIAAQVGVSRQALHQWKQHREFIDRVHAHVEAERVALTSVEIASKLERVQDYQDIRSRLKQLIDQRAELAAQAVLDNPGSELAQEIEAVPGAKTGLLVRKEKVMGQGAAARTIVEWEIDRAAIELLLAVDKQAAQELGQWIEKSASTTQIDGKISLELLRKALTEETVLEGEYVES